MEEVLADCWQSAMLLMWYDDVFPLSNTTFMALFADGMIYNDFAVNIRKLLMVIVRT